MQLLCYNLYCLKRYINKGDLTTTELTKIKGSEKQRFTEMLCSVYRTELN